MKISAGRLVTPLHEVLRWVYERSSQPKGYSISLCSHHTLSSSDLGSELAHYLNEFDPDGEGAWRYFDPEFIAQATIDPSLRRAIKTASLNSATVNSERTDFEQTSAGIGALGHAILSGEASLLANRQNPDVFKVCLDCEELGPEDRHHCDLWLNAPRFDPRSQVTAIGDAFLDWRSRF